MRRMSIKGWAQTDDQHHGDQRDIADRFAEQAKMATPNHIELRIFPTNLTFRNHCRNTH